MNNLASLYVDQGHYAEAEPLLAAAVDGARRSLREQHPTIAEYLADYGACLTRLERYGEVETGLLEAHQTLSAALGPAHKKTIKSVRFLIALYDAWGKPDSAAQWQAKLDAAGPTGSSEDGR
jgi:tetratricopeptide (TPR) repeat protein